MRRLMVKGDKGEYRRCLVIPLKAEGTLNWAIINMLSVTKGALRGGLRSMGLTA